MRGRSLRLLLQNHIEGRRFKEKLSPIEGEDILPKIPPNLPFLKGGATSPFFEW
jgi:hypothetical protein